MSWTPTVTLALDGQTLPGTQVLNSVTIHRGRDSVDTQPRAGYVRLSLYDDGAVLPRTALDTTLSVTVDGTTLVTDADVSDSTVELVAYHADGGKVAAHRLRALGRLARLHRRGKADGRPAEHDGDRIAALLGPLAALPWNLAASVADTAGSWDDVPTGVTWDTVTPTPLDIDTPGQYQLGALDGDQIDPWQAAQQAANDALGVLAELRDGGIRYTDARGRVARVAADGWLELPAAAIVPDGLEVASTIGDLATTVRVGWGGGEEIAEDTDAVAARGGRLEHTVDTQLADQMDAQARAQRLLRLRSRDVGMVEKLPIRVDDLDPTLRGDLLALEVGTPVRVTDLPTAFGSLFSGVVEALTWTITRHTAGLELTVSAWELSEYAVAWNLLDPTDTWTDLEPTVTWTTAQELAS